MSCYIFRCHSEIGNVKKDIFNRKVLKEAAKHGYEKQNDYALLHFKIFVLW